MKDILFRGKTTEGKWVEGFFLKRNSGKCFIAIEKVFAENNIDKYCDFVFIEVIPETVGQFTGLTDKNGVNIFEGDIVYSTCNEYCKKGAIIWDEFNLELKIGKDKYPWKLRSHMSKETEIIGNIHDNPELLEA